MEENSEQEPMELSDEELIEQLAGAGLGPRDIAKYLGRDVQEFLHVWKDPKSSIRYHYDRGILLIEGKMAMSIAEQAAGGNITAAQQHIKMMSANEFCKTKERLLRGEL